MSNLEINGTEATLENENIKVRVIKFEPKNDKEELSVEMGDKNSIEIPSSFFGHKTGNNSAKVSFILYKDNSLFEKANDTNDTILGHVISVNIELNQSKAIRSNIRIRLNFATNDTTKNATCVYASMHENNTFSWKRDGLTLVSINQSTGVVTCESSHFTNFAVFAGYVREPKHAEILEWISIVGMVLSIVCLSLVVLSQMFFKKFRKGQYHIALLNLSVVLIIVNLLVLLGLDNKSNKAACTLVAVLLHYFLLVAFAMMLVEAILQYYKFVKVFDVHVSKFALKFILPAWILPSVVVILTAAIDYGQYNTHPSYCWLDKGAHIYAFLLPLGAILTINSMIFFKIIKGISCDRPEGMQTNQTKVRLVWLQVQAGICCFVVMGLTWIFSPAAFGELKLAMQYLFTIFNSLQGFFVFVLFCLREKQVRKAWYALLCKPKSAKKFTLSTESSSFASRIRNRHRKEQSDLATSEFSSSKNTGLTDDVGSK